MTSNHIFWITTVIMFAGGLAIFASGKRRTHAEAVATVLHGIVPIIAGCAYLAMATGQGLVLLPTTTAAALTQLAPLRIFYFARYIDWTFTTPLLLVTLGLSSMRHQAKLRGALAGSVLADLLMIVTAFIFGASLFAGPKWIWFILSCIMFLGVYWVIWVPQMEASARERADIRDNYRRNALILTVVWLIYPIILAVSPDGLNVVSDAFSVLIIAILDIVAKVVYGIMAVKADGQITDRDLREGVPAIGTTPRSPMTATTNAAYPGATR